MLEADGRVRNQFHYPLDRTLITYLLRQSGIVLHAAGMVYAGKGVAFVGVSGAGKSTISGLAAGRPGWAGLSDDRVILRLPGKAAIHGTPWPGDARLAVNDSAPLAGLLFLERGSFNETRPLSAREALARLALTASLPWFDAHYIADGLAACDEIVRRIPCALLTFRPEAGAVETVERLLQEVGGKPSKTVAADGY
jgi:hypothetical protein